MKLHKRLLALLLAACMILPMIPVVQAEWPAQTEVIYDFDYFSKVQEIEEQEGNGLPGANVAESTTLVSFTDANGNSNADVMDEISGYYDSENKLNWDFKEFHSTWVREDRPSFVHRAYFYSQSHNDSKSTNNNDSGFVRFNAMEGDWIAFKIKNPGANHQWNITIKHPTSKYGAQLSNLYILPAETQNIGDALGSATELGSTSFYNSAVSSGEAPNVASSVKVVGTWTPGEAEEYIVVLEATQKNTDTATAYLYLSQLVLDYVPPVEFSEEVTYNFDYYAVAAQLKNGELPAGNSGTLASFNNTDLTNELTTFYGKRYLNWNFKEFYSTWVREDNPSFAHRAYFYSQSHNDSKSPNNNDSGFVRFNAMEGDWIAFTIRNPGAGYKWDLTLKHPTSKGGAAVSNLYILPADTQNIGEAITTAQKIGSTSFYNSSASGGNDAPNVASSVNVIGSWTAGDADEYIVVLEATKKHADADTAYLYLSQLVLNYIPPMEFTEELTYNFDYFAVAAELKNGELPAGNMGTLATFNSTELTNELTTFYGKGKLNWNFKEFYSTWVRADDPSFAHRAYFYSQSHNNSKTTNNNDSGFVRFNAMEGDWIAFTIRNPGAGYKWNLTLRHPTSKTGAEVSNLYILPADTEDIGSALSTAEEIGSTSFYNSSASGGNDAPNVASSVSVIGTWTPGNADEYIVVLEATKKHADAEAAYLYLSQLVLNYLPQAEGQTEVDYSFDYYAVAAELKNGELPAGNSGTLASLNSQALVNELTSFYSKGKLNWNFEEFYSTWVHPTKPENMHRAYFYSKAHNDSKDVNNNDSGYMRYTALEGDWIAFTIRNPGAGTPWYITMKHPTSVKGAKASNFYILPSDTADIAQALKSAEPIGTVNFYNSAVGSGDAPNVVTSASYVGCWTPGDADSYIVVMQATTMHPDTDLANLYLTSLHMSVVEPPPTVSLVDAEIVAQDAIKSYVPRVVATSVVNGHDYAYLALMGGLFVIYDMDANQLIDCKTDCFSTPRSIYVDNEGIVWASGAGSYIYRYDPKTNTSEKVSFNCVELFPGVSSFNAYGLTGDGNGNLYFGTYNVGYIGKVDTKTREVTRISEWLNTSTTLNPDAQHAGMAGVSYKDGYLYMGIDGDRNNDGITSHEIIKFNISTQKIEDFVDIYSQIADKASGIQYLSELQLIGDTLIAQVSNISFAVDIKTMDFVEIPGLEQGFAGQISDPVDGKYYMMNTKKGGLLVYDPAVNKVTSYGIPFEGKGSLTGSQCLATLNGVPSLVTYKSYDDRVDLVVHDLNAKTTYSIEDVTDGRGSGNQLRALTISEDGKTIYVSAYGNNNVSVYDVVTGQIIKQFPTYSHQTEGLILYKGQLYGGHYGLAGITKINVEEGNATPLFTLETSVFPQHRMHPFTAGDRKIFAATAPVKNRYGGVLTWYDIRNELVYVAAGPNPEDVFYTEAGNLTGKGWISAVTNQPADFGGFEDSILSDGSQRFTGLIENQSPNCIVYKDGYIFGSTTRAGGSSTTPISGNALLFVYDVAAMKVVATYDLCNTIEGLTTPVEFVDVIAADPVVDGKFWGVVSDTLFSFTFDHTTNTFNVKVELSLGTTKYNHGSNNWKSTDIVFDREFMYVRFGSYGVYMVSKDDPQTYYQLSRAVPKTMVLGCDDNLYFINNDNHLKVLRIADEVKPIKDPAEAKATQAMIDALPEVTMENWLEVEPYVVAAREAYDDLSPEAKAMITDISKLLAAEAFIAPLRAAADKVAADAVIALIAAIGKVTVNSKEAILAARDAYEALTANQQKLVTNYDVLLAAEAAYKELTANSNTGDMDLVALCVLAAALSVTAGVLLISKKRKFQN